MFIHTHTHTHTHTHISASSSHHQYSCITFWGYKLVFGVYYYYDYLNINHSGSMQHTIVTFPYSCNFMFSLEIIILIFKFTVYFQTLCWRQNPSFGAFRQIRYLWCFSLFTETPSFLLPKSGLRLSGSATQLSSAVSHIHHSGNSFCFSPV